MSEATDISREALAPEDKSHRRRTRRKRRRKIGLWSLLSVAVLALMGVMLVLSYLGTPIVVPQWAQDKMVERINAETGDMEVELGRMVVVVERGWQPRIELSDVRFSQRDGTPIAALARLSGTLAMQPLLEGKFQPKTIRLSGASLGLRRAGDGRINIALGGTGDADMREVIARIDRALQRPALAALSEVQADNIALRYEDARAGRAWNVDGGRISLTRDDANLRLRGDFTLLGARAYATALEMTFASRIGDSSAEISVNIEDMPAGDIAGQSPALAWLGAVDAPISGALRATLEDDGTLGPLNATLQIGEGVLQPLETVRPIAFSSARTYFTYDPDSQALRFDEVTLDSKWGQVRADGQAYLLGIGENGLPGELQAQMRLREIVANPANFYPAPIRLDAASMDMRLLLDPFRLSIGELTLQDQDNRMVVAGDLTAAPEGWDIALNGQMAGLGVERLMQLWPEAVQVNARQWIAENVEAGRIHDVQLAVRSEPGEIPDAYLNFNYSDLTTRFVRQMPMIRNGAGMATLYGERFAIHATEGYVQAAEGGRIDIAGTSFIVPDVNIRRGPAIAELKLKSTITAALSLLDEPPLNFMRRAGQPVTLADGRADLEGRLEFALKPELKTEDVTFTVDGTLTELRSDKLVENRVLAADRLRVRADEDGIEIGGDGRLGQVPFSGVWKSALLKSDGGKSQLDGTVELSERFVEEFGIGLPPGSISGTGTGEIKVELTPDGGGSFDLRSNLKGVAMRLDQLSWSKPAAAVGELHVTGTLGSPPGIDKISLNAPGLEAQGAVRLAADGALRRAVLSKVNVGGWLEAPVELIGRGQGATPEVRVNGGRVDLRRTSLSAGPGSASRKGAPVILRLDRLTVSDGIALTEFRANLNTSGGTSGQFAGRVNGGTTIEGTIVPERGRSAFRIISQDAGGVMRSANFLKQARGGNMELILRPGAAEGSYNGRLQASNVWLTDAPALAALLNAISVVGLLEQMSGNGIHFGDVDAQFSMSPDQITLFKSSAVGNSLGITMDGYYWPGNGVMDMQGVVSPIYLVNGIGGFLTRRGEGLVGFNYKLKGSAESPRVRILPLTIFTPGMFRDMFRRAPPGSNSAREEKAREAPGVAPSDTK